VDGKRITEKGCEYRIIYDVDRWRKENVTPKNWRDWYYNFGGRETMIKAITKRRRRLKWIPLFFNPFPEEVKVAYHHINNILTIPLPSSLHIRTPNKLVKKHRQKCNDIIKKLYDLNLDNILSPDFSYPSD